MPVIVWALASSVLVQGVPQAAPSPIAEAYFLFLEGTSLEGKGDVDGAVRAYRQALELVPDAADIHAQLAGLYARQGRAVESVSEARQAIAIDPDNREGHRILGFVLGTIGEQRGDAAMRDEGIDHFERALEGGVRDPAAELSLGRLAVRSGRNQLAIEWLTTFLRDQPAYPEAMELLAEAYEASGRPAEAAQLVEDLVSRSTDQARMRSWLAELHEAAGAWERAAAVWRELESSDPNGLTYSMRRAMALANGGNLAGAREALVELEARAPENVRVWYLRSQIELRAGNPAAAIDAAERIRKLDEQDPMGLLALAEARVAAGEPARAIELLEPRVSAGRAEDIESGMFTRLSSALASALQEAGHPEQAVTALERAAARVPDDDGLRFNLGAAYDRDGRFEEAEQAFRAIIARDPAHAEALNYLGYLLADRGERLDEAISLINRALDVERDNPSYLDSLGWARYRRGEFDKAQEPLERAARALPHTSVIQDHLGDLYVQLKRFREAVGAFERALAGDRLGIDVAEVERKRARARELAGGR